MKKPKKTKLAMPKREFFKIRKRVLRQVSVEQVAEVALEVLRFRHRMAPWERRWPALIAKLDEALKLQDPALLLVRTTRAIREVMH